MQEVKDVLRVAQDKMLQADHLAFMTYPQLKEPKLLALIVEDVNVVFTDCMNAMLDNERKYKRVSPSKGEFMEELDILRYHCFKRFGIPPKVAQVISEVRHLAGKSRSCAMEFKRKDNYVLCSDDYKMDTLNITSVRDYVSEAKRFLEKTKEVLA